MTWKDVEDWEEAHPITMWRIKFLIIYLYVIFEMYQFAITNSK